MLRTNFHIDENENISWYFMRKAYNQMIHPAFKCVARDMSMKNHLDPINVDRHTKYTNMLFVSIFRQEQCYV